MTNRPDVRGVHGAVSSDHPLATAAGYAVLRDGGNAVDAVVTMAGVLAVVRPHMNGVGGDAFGIFYDGATGNVVGMNGSGRAGALATPSFFAQAGQESVPGSGPLSVSLPGAVAAWDDALARFGTISLAEALAPAVSYAQEGFPWSSRLASDIAGASGGLNEPALGLYLPGGSPPPVGTLLKNPALAATLERIARAGKDAFYRGEPAEIGDAHGGGRPAARGVRDGVLSAKESQHSARGGVMTGSNRRVGSRPVRSRGPGISPAPGTP